MKTLIWVSENNIGFFLMFLVEQWGTMGNNGFCFGSST